MVNNASDFLELRIGFASLRIKKLLKMITSHAINFHITNRRKNMKRRMEAYENLQFDSEVYCKLQQAEQEAMFNGRRHSSEEVLAAMKNAIEWG